MADTTNAANWNSSQGNSSSPGYADSTNNGIPVSDTDPKELFDSYQSTQSSPQGYYPFGIATGETGIEDYQPDADDRVMLTPPSVLPRRPIPGEMSSRSDKLTFPRQ